MKYSLTTLCFFSLLLLAIGATAQNGAYSSYYTYTVSYNGDGSANVTPTAEVSGIDDVSDWVEGQYRPLCTVRPKIQLNGDADWVGGTRLALGRAVDQIHTGQAVHVPADGSAVGLDFAVEADVMCSGAPNPNYYQYPDIARLNTWSQIDVNFWFLSGFAPVQTSPPFHLQYCPSAVICPVNYGVASIRNFVDFADFLSWGISIRTTYYGPPVTLEDDECTWHSTACSSGTHPTCPFGWSFGFVNNCPNYIKGKFLVVAGECLPLDWVQAASGPGPCN